MDGFDLLRAAVMGAFSVCTLGVLAALVYYRSMKTQLEKVPYADPPKPVMRVLACLSYIHLPVAIWYTATFVVRYLGGLAVVEGLDTNVLLSLVNYLVAYVVLLVPPAALLYALYDFEQGGGKT